MPILTACELQIRTNGVSRVLNRLQADGLLQLHRGRIEIPEGITTLAHVCPCMPHSDAYGSLQTLMFVSTSTVGRNICRCTLPSPVPRKVYVCLCMPHQDAWDNCPQSMLRHCCIADHTVHNNSSFSYFHDQPFPAGTMSAGKGL